MRGSRTGAGRRPPRGKAGQAVCRWGCGAGAERPLPRRQPAGEAAEAEG